MNSDHRAPSGLKPVRLRCEYLANPLGKDADGKWELALTLPGAPPRRFDGLATGSPDFANLTWIGWSSMATKKTVFYLDNVKVENR